MAIVTEKILPLLYFLGLIRKQRYSLDLSNNSKYTKIPHKNITISMHMKLLSKYTAYNFVNTLDFDEMYHLSRNEAVVSF